MRKKTKMQEEPSLFDDTFFDTPKEKEPLPVKTHTKKANREKTLFFKELLDVAIQRAEQAAAEGHVVAIPAMADTTGGSMTAGGQGQAKSDAQCGPLRDRAKRMRLRITFDDGTCLCHTSATATMIEAIDRIGAGRVAALGMEVCHVPLVSTEVTPRYARWTKKICDGWYLMAQSDTTQKYMQMKSIATQLGINAKIEIGDFDTLAAVGSPTAGKQRKKKTRLEVAFGDGTVILAGDAKHSYIEAFEHIGIEKVRRSGFEIGGMPAITPARMLNSQTKLACGLWLIVSATTSGKQKILRTVASVTHTPLTTKAVD